MLHILQTEKAFNDTKADTIISNFLYISKTGRRKTKKETLKKVPKDNCFQSDSSFSQAATEVSVGSNTYMTRMVKTS